MEIELYQIDAFTDKLFAGNPAAVCPLDEWLEDDVLQKIAIENNLAETAFFIKLETGNYHLRWFTPEIEMDLCGHATLASAYVLFEELAYPHDKIIFESKSGPLVVNKIDDYLQLDFPSRPPKKAELPSSINQALNIQPLEVWKARDYLLVYESEEEIKKLKPNIGLLDQVNIDPGGIIVTAKGEEVDFVSRFFTPQASVFEDPVTGSAHCTLVPFWASRLNKTEFHARQISSRSGELYCDLKGERVYIRGKAIKYLKGIIEV
jgi:PhzF family phenazine biosynthesis protein